MSHNIALICGSMRKASTHAGILRAIVQAKHPRFTYSWVQIRDFPFFDEDIESAGYPKSVERARQLVGRSDAILFGIPEYNHSISGVLKNSYDWLSRTDKNKYCPIKNKIGAMVSTGYSMCGKRGQQHFKQIAVVKNMRMFEPSKQAQFLVSLYEKPFDVNGNLINEAYIKRIKLFLDQFDHFITKNTQ